MLRLAVRRFDRTRCFQRAVARCLTTSDTEDRMRKAEAGALDHKTQKKIPLDISRTKHTPTLEHQRGARPDATKLKDEYLDLEDLSDDEGKFSYLSPPGGGGGPGGIDRAVQEAAREAEESRQLEKKYHEKDHLYYWLENDYDPMNGEVMDDPPQLEASKDAAPTKTLPLAAEDAADAEEEIMEIGDTAPETPEEDDSPETFNDDDLAALEKKEIEAAGGAEVISDYDRNNDIITMLSDDKYLEKFEHMTIEQLEQRNKTFNTIKEGIDIYDSDPQTRFEAETYDNPNPNMLREPKAFFLKQRLQPPREFIEGFRRFLFVTGLPPLTIEGKLADIRDTTHQTMVRRAIVEALGKDIDTTHVYATDPSSGFIGFDSEIEVAKRLVKEPKQPVLSHNMTLNPINDSKGFGEAGTVLKLEHIPMSKHTPTSLLRELFPPKDSNEGAAFENLTLDDIKFISATRALIRFKSVDEALNASNSPYVKQQLHRLSQYPLMIFRARRELIHKGYGPYPFHEEERKLGYRLIADGDMPTKPFYTSHAAVLRLSNLDPAVSPYELSLVFQPFCSSLRDEIGSLEIIRCERGHATGVAYVGFDLPGEAEAALKGLPMKPTIGDRKTLLHLVTERKYPLQDYVAPERRPDRSVEELERDLNDWEQHVDPKDVQILLNAGIRKEVLDDALRAMRHGNPSFGPLDTGLRSEALEPEKGRGQRYRDIVRLYIETLKECLVMPDDYESIPRLYKFLHFPDEELDMNIFEKEKEKQEKQAKFRSSTNS